MIINSDVPRMETIINTARLLKLPEHFVRNKVITGEVVSVKIGRKYLVNVDKFIEYLNISKNQKEVDVISCAGIVPVPIKIKGEDL